jgi:hypothetical protein
MSRGNELKVSEGDEGNLKELCFITRKHIENKEDGEQMLLYQLQLPLIIFYTTHMGVPRLLYL